jgi:hypothetical protein
MSFFSTVDSVQVCTQGPKIWTESHRDQFVQTLGAMGNRRISEIVEKLLDLKDPIFCACKVGVIFSLYIQEIQKAQKNMTDSFIHEKETIDAICSYALSTSTNYLWLSAITQRMMSYRRARPHEISRLLQTIRATVCACAAVDKGQWTRAIVPSLEDTILQIERERPDIQQYIRAAAQAQKVQHQDVVEYQASVEEFREAVLKPDCPQRNSPDCDIRRFAYILRFVTSLFQQLNDIGALNRLDIIETIARHAIGIQCERLGLLSLLSKPVDPVVASLDIEALIQSFRSRPWIGQIQFTGPTTIQLNLPSLIPLDAKKLIIEDRMKLKSLLVEHNIQFAQLTPQFIDDGIIQKHELNEGDLIYIIGDLHADGLFFLLHIEMLRREGFLDANYCCRPGFHLVVIGDAVGRGPDVEWVLSVILALHMRNPLSVHPMLGNHEDANMSFRCQENPNWPPSMAASIGNCFATFPIIICAGAKPRTPRTKHHFVHFSHALFSTNTKLSPLLRKTFSASMLLSCMPHIDSPDHKSPKYQYSYYELEELEGEARCQGTTTQGMIGCLWSRVGERGPSPSKMGYVLPPTDLQAYSWVSGDDEAQVKFYVRGHGHEFFETLATRFENEQTKVISMTLPSGFYGKASDMIPAQGLGVLLKVGERASAWTKRLSSVQQGDRGPLLALEKQEIGLYKSFNLSLRGPDGAPIS